MVKREAVVFQSSHEYIKKWKQELRKNLAVIRFLASYVY